MISDFKFYDHLLQFPLFQGLSRSELLQMAGNTKFGFLKLPSASEVARADAPATQLFFLIRGRLSLTTASDDGSYAVTEYLSAPWLLQPESFFGKSTRYRSHVQTVEESHFITLSKDEVLRLLDDFLIVRLNMLNMMAMQLQRRGAQSWRKRPSDLRQRVVRFFLDHCVYPAGAKEVRILMETLAQELNDSRLNVSRVLNEMERQQLVVLHRGRIEIPLIERLLM